MISKSATASGRFHRPSVMFESARAAFEAYLRALQIRSGERILLPDYIGWSAREGSGVFDPVRSTGVGYDFYKLTRLLEIDLADLARKLKSTRIRLLVVIHYFGRPDPRLEEVAAMARSAGVPVLEDAAHALFSDYIGGICGNYGDASIYSLHKMLPLPSGGMIRFNGARDGVVRSVAESGSLQTEVNPFSYDWLAISKMRLANASSLVKLLKPLHGEIEPLWPFIPEGLVPQTFPILIRRAPRDHLYAQMNAAGYGVVSLYHTLVDTVDSGEHPDAHWVARHILNLPVHQDVDLEQLEPMVERLTSFIHRGDERP